MGKKLIIVGADFHVNAIEDVVIVDDAVYELVNKVGLDATSLPVKLVTGNARANALVTRESVDNPNTWRSGSVAQADTYSMIPIPYGASKVTIKCTNTSYYYGLSLRNSQGETVYDSGWQNGGQASVVISGYPTAVYVSSTLKIGSAGTASFSNETLQSVGWSIHWE